MVKQDAPGLIRQVKTKRVIVSLGTTDMNMVGSAGAGWGFTIGQYCLCKLFQEICQRLARLYLEMIYARA
jgi:hypothetical protein